MWKLFNFWACDMIGWLFYGILTLVGYFVPNSAYTGWNDKIVALEKTTWFYFRLLKTGFHFLLETIY